MATEDSKFWDLESFLDSLILELDKAQDTLAMKGLTRRLTYTVQDAALELQIFPRYDAGRIRFATAMPGESGASRLSIQLGSITDRQIRETANEPIREDDIRIEAIEDLDEDVKESLKKVGVHSARDLERIGKRNVDVSSVVEEKTGRKKKIDYAELAHIINKAKRRRSSPRVDRVSRTSSVSGTELVFDGDHLATNSEGSFPVARVNGALARIREATGRRLRVEVPEKGLQSGANEIEVALDPYAIMTMHVNA